MRIILGILVTAFTFFASPAFAINWIPVLKNTPAERFDDEDLRLFLEAGRKVLDGAPDNQPVTWENPKTKAGGELTVLKSFEWKGHPCKTVRVRNHAEGRKNDVTLNACRVDDRWKFVTQSQLSGKSKK
jgi:surface antigen